MLHGPAGLVDSSCGIRLTPLESMTHSCFLAKAIKETSIGSFSSISSPFRKGTSSSCMLLPSPFRTRGYFNNSVPIGPTSISLYEWMLSSTLCVDAKCCVDTLYHISLICCLVPSWLPKGLSLRSQC